MAVSRFLSRVSSRRMSSLLRPRRNRSGTPRLCRRFHFITSHKRSLLHISGFLMSQVFNTAHGEVRSTTSTNYVVTGNGPIGDGCQIGPRSIIAVVVAQPPQAFRVLPRGVPVGVICRSSSLLIISGPTKLIMRPKRKGCAKALIGTLT